MQPIAALLQAATVVNQAVPQPVPVTSITFTQLVATVSIVVGLCTIGTVLYRMGMHAADLANTKANWEKEMKGLREEIKAGFLTMTSRLDRNDGREEENVNRRNEWSRWRERKEGELAAFRVEQDRLGKLLDDAIEVATDAVSRADVLDAVVKPIAEAVKLRKRPLGDEL